MARKAVSRKRKAPASPGAGSDAQGPQVRASRPGRWPEPQQRLREFQLGTGTRDRAGHEPGSETVESWPVLLQFTGMQAGRKGEEPKGNSKMTPSAGSLQLGIELEVKPGPPRSCRKLSSRGIWEGERSQPFSGTMNVGRLSLIKETMSERGPIVS